MIADDPLHRDLLSFCRHQLGVRSVAEDVARRTLAEHDPQDGPVALFAAALRACREEPWVGGRLETAGLADVVLRRDDVRELLASLAALGEDQRAALLLCEVGSLTNAQAAQVMGIRRDQLRSLVFAAREAIAADRGPACDGCRAVRAEISVAKGAVLRTGRLRRHPASCPPCAEWAAEVRRQRAALAVALPVDAAAPLVATGAFAALAEAAGGAIRVRTLAAALVIAIAGLGGYVGISAVDGGGADSSGTAVAAPSGR